MEQIEARFRAFMDNCPAAVFLKKSNGEHLYVNSTAAQLAGTTINGMIGHCNQDIFAKDTADQLDRVDNQVLEEGIVKTWTGLVKGSDGTDRWSYDVKFPFEMFDGETVLGGFGLDLTELRKNQKLLEETSEVGKVGGWEVNLATGKQQWTKEVYRIHEVDKDFEPTIENGINFYSEVSKPVISAAYQRAIERGESYDVELEIVTAKGNLRNVRAICKADLEQNRLYGFFQDITDKKKIENERESLIQELQKKTAEQERFIYTVSHDLKTPLVTISGYCGLAKEDLASGDQEGCKKNLDIISQAAKRMEQLLNELLHISRVGIQQNTRETINLEDLVKKAAESVSGEISKHKNTIEVEPGLPDVKVDKQGFLQVFKNLIMNASKYSRSASNGSHIKIGVVRNEQELICYVEDNGIGIEAQYLEKVFGLFERLDVSADSTGVGLAIVKRIIENHGGRIWAESEGLGNGTTFFFTVPEA